jgi:D-3-phosphoglycerate dehydrogenase
MVDAKFLQKTRKDVIIINTSRGKVLKTRDLLDALENGEVQGTCLDVLENERMDQLNSEEKAVYQKLFELENVVLSPHIAGWTHQSLFKIANVLADKILSKEPT